MKYAMMLHITGKIQMVVSQKNVLQIAEDI